LPTPRYAPSAGFGDTDFYPEFVDKAAVLIVRLAKNHPLPDGNRRTAWVALRVFVDRNGPVSRHRHSEVLRCVELAHPLVVSDGRYGSTEGTWEASVCRSIAF